MPEASDQSTAERVAEKLRGDPEFRKKSPGR
ncbi:hypothetical protein J2X68_005147 [Streptomyces sp. 3330]|nr:hypothetical protein [Streptomyces sp. 3330]